MGIAGMPDNVVGVIGRIPYLEWREGRPRWVPGPALRGRGFKGVDLKDPQGRWLDWRGAAEAAQTLNEHARGETAKELAGLHEVNTLLASVARSNQIRGAVKLGKFPRGEYVYVFGMDARWAKIGFTTDMQKRFDCISQGLPLPLTAYVGAKGTRFDEQSLHIRFDRYKLKNEWFRIAGELAVWLADCAPTFRKVSREVSKSHAMGEQTF